MLFSCLSSINILNINSLSYKVCNYFLLGCLFTLRCLFALVKFPLLCSSVSKLAISFVYFIFYCCASGIASKILCTKKCQTFSYFFSNSFIVSELTVSFYSTLSWFGIWNEIGYCFIKIEIRIPEGKISETKSFLFLEWADKK